MTEKEKYMTQPTPQHLTDRDFTPQGTKIEGQYENDRNAENSKLFSDIIKEACEVDQVIVAHHLVYVKQDTDEKGFKIQIVEEIPSADSLIFDHEVAEKIWGPNFHEVLADLATTPLPQRDAKLAKLYYTR
jgi:hypothetical protein